MTTGFDVSELQRWSAVPLRLIVGYGFIATATPRSRMGRISLLRRFRGWGSGATADGVGDNRVRTPRRSRLLVGAYIPVDQSSADCDSGWWRSSPCICRTGSARSSFAAVTASGPQFGPPGI